MAEIQDLKYDLEISRALIVPDEHHQCEHVFTIGHLGLNEIWHFFVGKILSWDDNYFYMECSTIIPGAGVFSASSGQLLGVQMKDMSSVFKGTFPITKCISINVIIQTEKKE